MRFVFYLLATIVLAQDDLVNFKCPADGYAVALGCSNAQQCRPYTVDPVDCIDGACCIKSNNNSQVPHPVPLFCSNGGVALVVGCTQSQQCLPFTKKPVACLQGLCCTVRFPFSVNFKSKLRIEKSSDRFDKFLFRLRLF